MKDVMSVRKGATFDILAWDSHVIAVHEKGAIAKSFTHWPISLFFWCKSSTAFEDTFKTTV